MIKINLSALFFLVASICIAQTNLYQHENFDTLTADHEVIAVVPFEATVELKPK